MWGTRGSWILNPEAWSLSEVPWLEQVGSFLTPEVTRESSLGRAPLSASFSGSWGAGSGWGRSPKSRASLPREQEVEPPSRPVTGSPRAGPPLPSPLPPAPPHPLRPARLWELRPGRFSLKSFLPLPSLNPARPEGRPRRAS